LSKRCLRSSPGSLNAANRPPPQVLDYASLHRSSNELTPIVFVLSPGADPAFDVFRRAESGGRASVCLAPCLLQGVAARFVWLGNANPPGAMPLLSCRLGESLGFKQGGKLKQMALGQGMGPKAAELVETGAQRGLWVMLQVGAALGLLLGRRVFCRCSLKGCLLRCHPTASPYLPGSHQTNASSHRPDPTPELPPAAQVAQDPGEAAGAARQAPQGLPPVADHGALRCLPTRHPAGTRVVCGNGGVVGKGAHNPCYNTVLAQNPQGHPDRQPASQPRLPTLFVALDPGRGRSRS
jgi:hypothetical protein